MQVLVWDRAGAGGGGRVGVTFAVSMGFPAGIENGIQK